MTPDKPMMLLLPSEIRTYRVCDSIALQFDDSPKAYMSVKVARTLVADLSSLTKDILGAPIWFSRPSRILRINIDGNHVDDNGNLIP